jgi:hypothetical protein
MVGLQRYLGRKIPKKKKDIKGLVLPQKVKMNQSLFNILEETTVKKKVPKSKRSASEIAKRKEQPAVNNYFKKKPKL